MKNSLRSLLVVLARAAVGREENLLQDLFFIDRPAMDVATATKAGLKKGVEGVIGEPVAQPEGTRWLSLAAAPGGFTIKSRPNAKPRPTAILVETAYDVRRGNPFSRYESFDFELDKPPVRLDLAGGATTLVARNRLVFVPAADTFSVTVTGFDRSRDLKVRVRLSEGPY